MQNEDTKGAEQTITGYFAALNAGDAEKAVGYYTADGMFVAAGAPAASGTEQLTGAYTTVFGAIKFNVTFQFQEVIVRDDIAFIRTESHGSTVTNATGKTDPEHNREFFLLRKEGGSWKIARYMFNLPG